MVLKGSDTYGGNAADAPLSHSKVTDVLVGCINIYGNPLLWLAVGFHFPVGNRQSRFIPLLFRCLLAALSLPFVCTFYDLSGYFQGTFVILSWYFSCPFSVLLRHFQGSFFALLRCFFCQHTEPLAFLACAVFFMPPRSLLFTRKTAVFRPVLCCIPISRVNTLAYRRQNTYTQKKRTYLRRLSSMSLMCFL